MAKKQSSRGRKQERARVAGGQDYETRYEARKTGRSKSAVKKAVKKVGNSRKSRAVTRPLEGGYGRYRASPPATVAICCGIASATSGAVIAFHEHQVTPHDLWRPYHGREDTC